MEKETQIEIAVGLIVEAMELLEINETDESEAWKEKAEKWIEEQN